MTSIGVPAVAVRLDAHGVVDLRQVPAFEFDVDDRTDDLDDLADLLCCCDCCCHSSSFSFRLQLSQLRSEAGSCSCSSYNACAPDTTSMISRVIAAWRTLFMYSVRLLDHLAGVARRGVHRRHLRGVERGVRLEQRAEHLHLDVASGAGASNSSSGAGS